MERGAEGGGEMGGARLHKLNDKEVTGNHQQTGTNSESELTYYPVAHHIDCQTML